MINERTIVNSSGGKGIMVSIDRGSRTEFFMNSSQSWYLAAEIVLEGQFFELEVKSHGLGDLRIYGKSWVKDSERRMVASFPKGTWEYARLLMGDRDSERETDRNLCPEGCYVTGFTDLSEATQRAHMDYNH